MRLSFSTLGCPDWSFDTVLAQARAYGFDGIGFRGIGGQLDLAKVPEFTAPRRAATAARLEAAGLAAAMILTSGRLIGPEAEVEANLALVERHIDIAADVGAPFVRVFGGHFPPGLTPARAVTLAAARLRRLGDHGMRRNVTVLLETHDDFTEPALLAEVMVAADHKQVAVLWDIHHPFRQAGQPVEAAWAALAPWVRSIDIKDSVADPAARLGYRYVPLGEGDVPIMTALRLLATGGYDGFLTFEWEKRLHPELAEPEVAFPRFIDTMRAMLATL